MKNKSIIVFVAMIAIITIGFILPSAGILTHEFKRKHPQVAPDTAPVVSTSASANDSNAESATELSPEEVMENAREVTPSLGYTCPYEDSKCVATMDFSDNIKHLTSWDIYIFTLDNVIGTWIVNEAGNNICFYGDAFLYSTDNRTIHLGYCMTDGENIFYERHLCIRSNLSDINSFVVSTYPWNITSPITL